MLAVPVTVHFQAAGSSGSTRLISCIAQASGTVQDLQQSIETQLKANEQLTSLLYRGLTPALSSPLQDFTADQGLLPRFQARCCHTSPLTVQLPDGKSLQLPVRDDASFHTVEHQLEAIVGEEMHCTHSLLSCNNKSGMLRPVGWFAHAATPAGCSLVLAPKLNISLKQTSGDTVQLVCCPTTTVLEVRRTLWHKNCNTSGQHLMLGSQRLDDKQSLSSSGVLEGSVLELAPEATTADFITICGVTQNGVRVYTKARPDSFCQTVSHSLLGQECIPKLDPDSRIMFNGCRLSPDDRLDEAGITDGAILDLSVEQTGGGCGAAFADLDNSDALEKQAFSAKAPDWRVAGHGLNVEGECRNAKCNAYGCLIIDRKGFCCFNLLQDAAQCPLCSEQIEAVTCAFVGCAWMFDGRKLDPEGATVCCSSDWQDVASDMYSRFSEDGNMVVWESLIICARPSHMESPCPICYEGFSSYVPFLTSCKHAFHEGCLAAWHKHKAPATCPMCRGDLLAMVDSLSI